MSDLSLPTPPVSLLKPVSAPGTAQNTGGLDDAARRARIDKTAKDYEAGFVTAMLESMFAGINTNKMFGGGSAEGMYRSLLNQEYGKAIAERGSLGIADTIKREMLRMQEVH